MILEGEHLQVHFDDVEPQVVQLGGDGSSEVEIRFLIGSATTGTHDATMWRARFGPGADRPRHTHDSAEIFFVMSGRGAAGTVDREYEVPAGSALYVPAGATHWLRNPGDEDLEILGLYLPGGSRDEAGFHYVGEVTDEFRQV